MASETKHYFSVVNEKWSEYWDSPAFSDYGESTHYTYGELSTMMAKLGVLFREMGIQKGDKIAFCSGNRANWAVAFLAVEAYGAVGVSILPDFTGTDIEKLVNHSDAKILFVSEVIFKKLHPENLTNLMAVISLENFSLSYMGDVAAAKAYENWNAAWLNAYPNGYTKDDIHYVDTNLDELALINYTSGTTSAPKGVMLSWRALSTNAQFGTENIPCKPGDAIVNMLPLAHMFGMMFEFMYPTQNGVHVYFITKMATPILMKAFAECKPYLILTVPLVIEKIYKKKLAATVNKLYVRALWNIPVIGSIIRKKVLDGLMQAFGGQINSFIVGGAALNSEVEKCLMDVKFPLLVGYGMTETAPLIGYVPWREFVAHSCGRIVDRMEIRIDSEDSRTIPGEIQVRGEAVMMGYYKNEEATKAVFTEDGWLRTGDLGIIDANGNIFIKGRSKNMLLGASGQNIYPEELEEKLNSMPGVGESIVVSRNGKLIALIYPDPEYKLPEGENIVQIMDANRLAVNRALPNYSQIANYELVESEFEKTPKRSIKRFLYK